ncbi:hypothetical protein [Nocardiopsis potens]|uniref:hypothetical protein n=1 Tax=Nocardiopsis potens TaxID=1246458 RepID=UPI001268760E|nr:hypothetical protein [Nocardiopsis potens]
MQYRQLARRTLGTLAITFAVTLPLTSSSYADEELPVLATANASDSKLGDSYIEVNEVKRSSEGGYTQVTWTLRARGGVDYDSSKQENELYYYLENGMSGVTALDKENQIRYHPLQDEKKVCMCAGTYRPVNFITTVGDEKSSPYWNSFLFPESTSEISLEFPGFEPTQKISLK